MRRYLEQAEHKKAGVQGPLGGGLRAPVGPSQAFSEMAAGMSMRKRRRSAQLHVENTQVFLLNTLGGNWLTTLETPEVTGVLGHLL